MDTPNVAKYLGLRTKLLTLRKAADTTVYGTKAFYEDEELLDAMDDLWYDHLSEEEIKYINSLPAPTE